MNKRARKKESKRGVERERERAKERENAHMQWIGRHLGTFVDIQCNSLFICHPTRVNVDIFL